MKEGIILKIMVAVFIIISAVSLAFTIFQLFQTAPQLTEIIKDFLVYISINLISILGLSITLYLRHEKSREKMENLYEELMDLNAEDDKVFAKFQEFAFSLVNNPEIARKKETRERIKELMKEYEDVASKSEKALLKLLGKIVDAEGKKR